MRKSVSVMLHRSENIPGGTTHVMLESEAIKNSGTENLVIQYLSSGTEPRRLSVRKPVGPAPLMVAYLAKRGIVRFDFHE